MARGSFDMQHRYRAVILDDAASQGVWLQDVDGNVFLDLFANFALGALGYNHPALVEVARSPAFVAAAANPTSTPFLTSPSWIEFLEGVRPYAPKGMTAMYCVDGGGEGVESAMKAAFIRHGERRRAAAGRPADPLQLTPEEQCEVMDNAGTDAVIISFSGAFHGRSIAGMTATHSKLIHKADLPAFGWPTAIFPAARWPRERYAEENLKAEAEALTALEHLLDRYAGRVAAILVEPIQSEGGDRHASAAFFRGVQALAKQAGAALILDEVQTGMGITGKIWAHEHFDLPTPPEMVTFGKKMQLGGFFAAPDHDIAQFGRMYQTRNGDRGRAMLGLATLRTIERDDLLANVRDTGAYFLARLQELSERHPTLLTEARGLGFLLAFDLPTPQLRDEFNKRALRRGVFGSYTGARSVRLRPHQIGRAHV